MVLKHSERVILWGADPLVTNDIDWLTTLHNGAGYFRALKAKGTKTISINPIATDTAEYLGSEWIAPRPGTDCAMMLGMIHELVRTKKTDEAFLAKCTYGWPELRDYVMGKTDGIEKTPAWAAQECGVPAEKIVELVHDMQSHRTMIMMGWGIQRIQYGELDGLCARCSARPDWRHRLFERRYADGLRSLPRGHFKLREAREGVDAALEGQQSHSGGEICGLLCQPGQGH